MSIGYASLTVGVPQTDLKSCILKNANEANLLQLISHNLRSLARMIDYNEKNNIMLFRISSSLIPFGSSPANKLPWWTIFSSQFQKIGAKICNSKMRVSLHPGQYTVLNSPNEEIVARAMADLQYHNQVLTSLGVGPAHKIVLHIGGVYQDKQQASKRFIANYQHLDQAIKERLVLENDDKLYNIEDVLEIATAVNAPVIFDNLHHAVNPDKHKKNDSYWIHACRKTWQKKDGKQKIHYSQQNQLKKTGSHSASIKVSEFMDFYDSVSGNNLDI
ncbi:MAG: UV DNA damage repair endonuclease UvsE, partial [Firmicutes bacterium]|nr:UV DNA damage repair endonuclease UvsE [Bacillota bacterium]